LPRSSRMSGKRAGRAGCACPRGVAARRGRRTAWRARLCCAALAGGLRRAGEHARRMAAPAAASPRSDARRRQEEGDDAALGRAVSYTALLCLLRGRAYAGLDNRARAIAWYTAALRADPFCHEAFQARFIWIGVRGRVYRRAARRPLLPRGFQARAPLRPLPALNGGCAARLVT